jgi:hypothetical protein
MNIYSTKTNGVAVKAYPGDAMTLLAFDLTGDLTKDCVGFTIQFITPKGKLFYLPNRLNFDVPGPAASVAGKIHKSYSSLDAPIQKFRWLHVPYSSNTNSVEFGLYKYLVTPRYWKNDALEALDPSLTTEVELPVMPFVKDKFSLSFTRGFMISQAYARRFGNDTTLTPDESNVFFDTSLKSGSYPPESGNTGGYSYDDQFAWMGWQARKTISDFISVVKDDQEDKYTLDVLAYDFDEPDIAKAFIDLAGRGKIRMILDNNETRGKDFETKKGYLNKQQFEKAFRDAAKGNSDIVRGNFLRQAHCKVFILKEGGDPVKVLTGSTNFSRNGLYINANHVIVMENIPIAEKYQAMFNKSIEFLANRDKIKIGKLTSDDLFTKTFSFNEPGIPKLDISFAPHTKDVATKVLDDVNASISAAEGSVLFAVMQLTKVTGGSVVKALRDMHNTKAKFSYGITDTADEIAVYKPGETRAKLVSTQLLAAALPEPFSTEVSTKWGHRVHHKMVVLDFNDANPIVFCGSSNFALGGEEQNNDNLLTIYDQEVATAFAIEAIRLIDHFQYRAAIAKTGGKPLVLKRDDSWLKDYFIENTMAFTDRKYFIK